MRRIAIRGALFVLAIAMVWNLTTKTENRGLAVQKLTVHASRSPKLPKRDRMDLAMAQEFAMTKDPALGRVPRERLYKAFQLARQKRQQNVLRKTSAAISNVDWTERGPVNFGGRTRAIMVDPTDATHKAVFAAGVSGGLWYTSDITVTSPTWSAVDDFFENLAITTLAYDPSDTQVMYFGTGEGWYNVDAVQGDGVFKSTDGGSTWSQLSSTAGNSTFYFIQKIVVHPTNGDVYVATRNNGVQRSTDGGATWNTVLSGGNGSSSYRAADLEFGADNSIYAAMGIFSTDGVYKSTSGDNGSWTKLNTGGSSGFPTSGFDRIELACAPSNSDVIYAFTQDASNNQIYAIYRSADAGSTWTTVSNPSSADPDHSDYTNGQAWYDLIAAVDPNDSNTLFTGGIDLYKSTDGGSNWTQISHWYGGYGYQEVHADQHAIVFQEGNSDVIYFGNDGGIYRTTDGTAGTPTLTHRNTGYNTIQFYACAMHPDAGSNHFLAGAQDNGSHRFSSIGLNNTVEVTGGDGAFCHIDQDASDYQYTAYVYNNFRRSTDGGQTFNTVDVGNTGRFINPTDYDNTNDKLYAASNADEYLFWDDPHTGTTFYTVSISLFDGRKASAVTVSPNVANRVYFGTDEGRVIRVNDAASSPSGSQINSGAGMPGAYISCIEVENGDENHILVTYSNYGTNSIWETTDGGSNWHSVEGDLPDMPVRWALINPNNSDQALVATELGIWSTDNLDGSSTDWEPSNTGLANVRTDMIQIRSSDKVMIAATHGRGLFSSDVFAAASADFSVDKTLAYQFNSLQFTDGSTSATSWSWDFGDGTTSTSQNPAHTYASAGKYTVTLTINGGEDTETKTDYIHILPNRGTPYLAADGGNFETNTDDFGSSVVSGSVNIWERGAPGNALTTLNSASNCWKTDLDSDVTTGTYSCALYTPSFNLSANGSYTLQFYKSMEIAYSNAPFGVYVEYSTDQGNNWDQLGTYNDGNGTNWYEQYEHDVTPNGDAFCSDFTNEITAYDISSLAGNSQVCFRIVFIIETGWSGGYDQDGFMVDDFSITGETNDASLPVELNAFNVTPLPAKNSVRLDWRTESEVDNAFWLIERKDGNGDFKRIKKITGQGTKSSATDYSYVDANLQAGMEYTYRLLDVALDGTVNHNGERTVLLNALPAEFKLSQNYPNPFNPGTVIRYQLPAAGKVQLVVYNLLGQKIRTLVNRKQDEGEYSVVFNAEGLAGGVYVYQLRTGKTVQTRKMVLVR